MKLPITTLLALAAANLKDNDSGTTVITPSKGLAAFIDGDAKELVSASSSNATETAGVGSIRLGDTLVQFGQEAESADFTVTFPIAFDEAPSFAMAHAGGNDGTLVSAMVDGVTGNLPDATTMNIKLFGASSNEFIWWIAIGKSVQ